MKASELVEKYLSLRDKKAEIKAEYEKKVAAVDGALDKIEAVLLNTFNTMGIENIKTPAGTAYVSVRTSATVADRDAFLHGFVIPNEAWEFLENRVSKSAVEQFKEANNDLPPGLNWREERVVNIRRSA